MTRLQKMLLAVALALGLHLALFFVFAPHLDGLTAAPVDVTGPALVSSAEGVTDNSDLPLFEPQPTEPLDSRDVAWSEEVPEPAPATIATPTKKLATASPRANPANNDVTDSASRMGAIAVEGEDSSYAQRVRRHLAGYAGALPPGASGEARVQFVVQPDGRVSNVQLVKRSGHAALDVMALSLPQQAQPLPLPGPQPQRLEVPLQAGAAAP